MELSDSDTNQTDSDAIDEELECELYSVIHYNVLSGEIPSKILEKYDIKRNENELLISLKNRQQQIHDLKDEGALSEKYSSNENVESDLDVVTISDDDNDSVIIINDSVTEITGTPTSTVIEINDSSSSDEMGDIIINIDGSSPSSYSPPVYDHLEKTAEVKWNEVVSPSNWTNKMKKYYNQPCEKLLNFSYEKISSELKGKGGNWDICAADRFPVKKNAKRCSICRQTGHLRKDCPRRFVNCLMCGNPGHNEYGCPQKKCLNCGQRNKIFIDMCQKCEENRFKTCNECKQIGHSSNNCPDTWRRFNVTTNGELVVKPETINEKIFCCNCAQRDHRYENCPKIYWSLYPPTTFLVQNKNDTGPESSKGKRSRSLDTSSFDFDRRPKISRGAAKRFHQSSNHFSQPHKRFNQKHSPLNPSIRQFKNHSPVGTPKRNNKMRYFQHMLIGNKGNINNHVRNMLGSQRKKKRRKKKNYSSINNTI